MHIIVYAEKNIILICRYFFDMMTFAMVFYHLTPKQPEPPFA